MSIATRVVLASMLLAAVADAGVPRVRAANRGNAPAPADVAGDPGCAAAPLSPQSCDEGSGSFAALRSTEVEAIVRAAARSLNINTLTIAVVDRAGRPLALYRKSGVLSGASDDLAIGVARTAAFFSHNQAPLSSRTVQFVSGVHFPPGITNTASGALYGIESTNRGCDFNVTFNPGKCVPRARRFGGAACDSSDASGCGLGIVTGKNQLQPADPSQLNAGGVPLYRVGVDGARVVNGQLLGGIGVVGAPGDPQLAEYAAATGAFGALAAGIAPVPFYPLPEPGNVFVDGIRLPFLGPQIRLTFDAASGVPSGVRMDGVTAGTDAGFFVISAQHGGCAANEYLAGPKAGSRLSASEVDAIVQRAIATSKKTRAQIRLPLNRYARMAIAVADTDGSILALYRMPDATVFSIDVAVAKARNVVWFSTSGDLPVPAGTAVTNRTIGFGAQPFYPPGVDSTVLSDDEGPWYRSLFLNDLARPCSQGTQPANPNQNGIVFFAGSSPLFRDRTIAGGLGVSGDGIEQDDYVTYHAAGAFLPAQDLWADRVKVDGARLPMFKFPRQPEGVTECSGGPCN